MRRWILIAGIAVLLAVAAACGSDGAGVDVPTEAVIPTPGLPATYVGSDGVATTIASAARIVTLSGDFSEIVWELGLGENLVGVDLSSVYPQQEMRLKPKVGVEFRLFTEAILGLDPTVVIGDEDAGPAEVIDQLRGAGVPVVILPRLFGVGAPATKIRAVAEVLGVASVGEDLAARVQSEVDAAVALARTAETLPKAAVVYIATEDQILLLGDNTVMQGMLAAVGATDVGPEAGTEGFVPLTPEALAAGAPEVIITAERGFEAVGGMEGFLALPGVAQTPAGEAGWILVYEDLYLLGLGPRAGQALRDVVLDLHPELASG